MNRDGVKTVIGLLIIGIIIVATFLYGNHQRQAQLRHDQDLKTQTQKTAQTTPQAAASPGSSSKTQPGVPSPTSNPIQGQGASTAVSTAPQTGGTAATSQDSTPRTGPDALAPLAMLVLIGAGAYYRRSRREVEFALVPTRRR